jgi:hypothetical protein
MSGSQGGFLTKSIILLALVLVSMGTSMYFGKQLGRNIMQLTRSNIERNFPQIDSSDTSDDSDFVVDIAGGRTSFGYEEDEFGTNQFPRDWADPTDEDFEDVSEDPTVDITILDDTEEDVSEATDTSEQDTAEEQVEEEPDTAISPDRGIFGLGDDSTFRIQVGTFSERENAENVWNSLTTAGYNASVSTFTDSDEIRYRVTVGTYHSREEADGVAEELRRMNFDAWVYEVN